MKSFRRTLSVKSNEFVRKSLISRRDIEVLGECRQHHRHIGKFAFGHYEKEGAGEGYHTAIITHVQ